MTRTRQQNLAVRLRVRFLFAHPEVICFILGLYSMMSRE
jgi:hypothetical protein